MRNPDLDSSIFDSTDRELASIVENCKSCVRALSAGTTLFHEGEVCKELYIIIDGWVSICRSMKNGRQLILNFKMPGAFLGFQSDLQSPLDNTARCVTNAKVCVIPRTAFVSLIENNPALAISLNNSKAEDEKVILDNLINIAMRPARARVAHLLLDLHSRVVQERPGLVYADIHLPLTRQNIADALGLTSVHVSRAISALQREKLLSFNRSRLQIHDFDELSEIAEFTDR